MDILLIGSGGREHALATKIAKSPLCDTLFITPGSDAMATIGEICPLDARDHAAVRHFVTANQIGLVVIGPEAPLVAGLKDTLSDCDTLVFGPDAYGAQIEGSKDFTKQLCTDYHIPTARYRTFEDADAAKAYINAEGAPIVVKADGLAAGKGVVVATTIDEACAAVDHMSAGGLGAAGARIVIEECLVGEEASAFFITDGTHILPFGTAQDHKRAFDGDTGPNTGGMGAYSPAPCLTNDLQARVLEEIIKPTVYGLKERGYPYCGVLYAGLMLTKDGPKLIEYNARFGDPECQVLMCRLISDIVSIMIKAASQKLSDAEAIFSDEAALTVVMAAKGYPGSYTKDTEIKGIERAEKATGALVFHAGTRKSESSDKDTWLANGGRVLNVTATAGTIADAQKAAYDAVQMIHWTDGFYRTDIGWRAI